jgi:hypothetical protein
MHNCIRKNAQSLSEINGMQNGNKPMHADLAFLMHERKKIKNKHIETLILRDLQAL